MKNGFPWHLYYCTSFAGADKNSVLRHLHGFLTERHRICLNFLCVPATSFVVTGYMSYDTYDETSISWKKSPDAAFYHSFVLNEDDYIGLARLPESRILTGPVSITTLNWQYEAFSSCILD